MFQIVLHLLSMYEYLVVKIMTMFIYIFGMGIFKVKLFFNFKMQFSNPGEELILEDDASIASPSFHSSSCSCIYPVSKENNHSQRSEFRRFSYSELCQK